MIRFGVSAEFWFVPSGSVGGGVSLASAGEADAAKSVIVAKRMRTADFFDFRFNIFCFLPFFLGGDYAVCVILCHALEHVLLLSGRSCTKDWTDKIDGLILGFFGEGPCSKWAGWRFRLGFLCFEGFIFLGLLRLEFL
jgi:hypothetical protein